MKKIIFLLFFICIEPVFFTEAFSSSVVISPIENANKPNSKDLSKIFPLKISDVEKITGKKLSLKEKIAFKIFKFKLNRELHRQPSKKTETDKGQLALILGIVGLAALFLPYAALISLPCAIAAIIIGYNARRENPSNKKAKTAIVLGWLTIGLFVLALLIVIAVLTSSFAWY